MQQCRVRGVRSVELAVTNLEEAGRFYESVWALRPVEARDGVQAAPIRENRLERERLVAGRLHRGDRPLNGDFQADQCVGCLHVVAIRAAWSVATGTSVTPSASSTV